MGWRESLEILRKQFEAQATRSRGLHHLMVEVADNASDRMRGPDWFVSSRGQGHGWADIKALEQGEPWCLVESSGLPGVHGQFRGVRPDESLETIPKERIICDGSGTPRAVFEPGRLRASYLCGDLNALKGFESLAEAASRILTGATDLSESELSDDVADLFRNPIGGIRYVFGSLIDPPQVFMARGWGAAVAVYPQGVVIDMPIAETAPSVGHWLLLLHRIAWRRIPGCALEGERRAWHGSVTVPYEWVVEGKVGPGFPAEWQDRFSQIPSTSYYSILGEREHPLDVNLASSFVISELLSSKPNTIVDKDGVSQMEEAVENRILSLAADLLALEPGNEEADAFVKIIAPVLEAVLSPSLKNPVVECKINEGRKRVDIVFSNVATSGFFGRLALHGVVCPYVFVECKNYSTDPANPEVDQLAGRLDMIRGMLGFLICRHIENKEQLIARCRDMLRQGKYILVLEDKDIFQLARLRANNRQEAIDDYLDALLRQLVS